jgi:hypothetical protein
VEQWRIQLVGEGNGIISIVFMVLFSRNLRNGSNVYLWVYMLGGVCAGQNNVLV